MPLKVFFNTATQRMDECGALFTAVKNTTDLNDLKKRRRMLYFKIGEVVEYITYFMVYTKGHFKEKDVRIYNEKFTASLDVDYFSRSDKTKDTYRQYIDPTADEKKSLSDAQRELLKKMPFLYGVLSHRFFAMKKHMERKQEIHPLLSGVPYFNKKVKRVNVKLEKDINFLMERWRHNLLTNPENCDWTVIDQFLDDVHLEEMIQMCQQMIDNAKKYCP